MRKYTLAFAAFLLAACGDTIENQMGMDVVDSVADLPKCTSKNEGEQALVKGESTVRVCVDGEWFATTSGDAGDFSCKTEELKDGSGLKIICNGDSIGVVLNGEKGDSGKDGKNGKDGEDGEDGKAGTGCAISGYTEATVTVVCGDSTMVLELGAGAGSDTLILDSEKVAVSFESLAGYSQKGPFLKGSTVYLYELSDGRTLKQTNGNFTSIITRDDGRYKFTARDLVSQYAMIVVDGNYRNEVTGKSSEAPIRLRAITDMRKRSDANINLLTHLEFDRVYYLVTREKKTVKQAKTQAQKEIFAAFHIDTTDVKVSAEDLDVFGKTDADAALLAISVLLQGDGNATDLSVLLTEIADDMETDGKWDGPNSAATRTRIADWAITADGSDRLDSIRNNVKGWGLGAGNVPAFEKYVRSFYENEFALGECGSKNDTVGTVKYSRNNKSGYYAENYLDVRYTKDRIVCRSDKRWYLATDLEKDSYGWQDSTVGAFKDGPITGKRYLYTQNGWLYYAGTYDIFDGSKDGTIYIKTDNNTITSGWEDLAWEYVDEYWSSESRFTWYETEDLDYGSVYQILKQCGGLCGKVNMDPVAGGSNSVAVLGFPVVKYKENEYGSVIGYTGYTDVTSWEGLCVTYTSDIPMELQLITDLELYEPEKVAPYVVLPVSAVPNTVCHAWDSFKMNGDGAITGDSAARVLTQVRFNFVGGEVSLGSFVIKGVSSIPGAAASSITETINAIGMVAPSIDCGDIWCGIQKDTVLKIGMDDNSYGYWFDSTDALDGGISEIIYPVGNWMTTLRKDAGDIIRTCKGVCGTASLRTFIFKYPYVYVGFTLSEDGLTEKDITSWEGVCVTYKSSSSFGLELGLTPEREEAMGYNIPKAAVPKAESVSVEDIPWSMFKQESGWGNAIYTLDDLQHIVSLKFKMWNPGDFAIYTIGRLGTCGQ